MRKKEQKHSTFSEDNIEMKNDVFESERQSVAFQIQNHGFIELVAMGEKFSRGTFIRLSLFAIISVLLALFHLWTSYYGILEAWHQRSLHITAILMLVYLLPTGQYIRNSEGRITALYKKINILFFLLSAGVFSYCYINHYYIVMREGNPNNYDKIVTIILILLVIEASRRMCGLPIAIIATFFIIYPLTGKYFPHPFNFPGFTTDRIVDQFFIMTNGIFGPAAGAASVFIVIFVMFGAFLMKSKTDRAFLQTAISLGGRFVGGPAKVAVIASALVGTIHGSGPGNVAITGSFTIPLMKRLGYEKNFAGAVEAAASNGGILLPPIMGATAFVLAEYTRTPYWTVCLKATIPAILYFFGVFVSIHLKTLKDGLVPVPDNEIPKFMTTVKTGGYMFLPIVVIIFTLAKGFSTMKAGFFGILSIIVISQIRRDTRINFWSFLGACEIGIKNMIMISTACAAAGIIVGGANITGIGIKISAIMGNITQTNLFIVLLLTAITCVLLGMGMPVVSSYVIVVIISGFLLQKLGIELISIHLFVFYFAAIAAITPPVALTSYAAAGIAEGDANKTGFLALKLALSGFIIPFVFIYNPALLIGSGHWRDTALVTIFLLIAIFFLSAGLQGYLYKKANIIQRILFIAGSIMIFVQYGGVILNILGVLILISGTFYNKYSRQK